MPIHESEIFEHTADIGLEMTRQSLNDLFRDMAFGMFYIMMPGDQFSAKQKKRIALNADDLEALLVGWLSELNYYFQTEQFVPAVIEVNVQGASLQADLQGEIFDRSRAVIDVEIKAVTYHKIRVASAGGQWSGRVLFDI